MNLRSSSRRKSLRGRTLCASSRLSRWQPRESSSLIDWTSSSGRRKVSRFPKPRWSGLVISFQRPWNLLNLSLLSSPSTILDSTLRNQQRLRGSQLAVPRLKSSWRERPRMFTPRQRKGGTLGLRNLGWSRMTKIVLSRKRRSGSIDSNTSESRCGQCLSNSYIRLQQLFSSLNPLTFILARQAGPSLAFMKLVCIQYMVLSKHHRKPESSFKAIVQYPPGSQIYSEGDSAVVLFLLLRGQVLLFEQGSARLAVIRQVRPFEVFGQHQLKKGLKKRQQNAQCRGKVVVQRIGTEAFFQPSQRLRNKMQGCSFEEFCQAAGMLKGLSYFSKKTMYERGKLLKYAGRTKICDEGQQADQVFFVLSGQFGLYKKVHQLMLNLKHPQLLNIEFSTASTSQPRLLLLETSGSLLGLEAVIGQTSTYFYSVICETQGSLIAFQKEVFYQHVVRTANLELLASHLHEKNKVLNRQFNQLLRRQNDRSFLSQYHFSQEQHKGGENVLKRRAYQHHRGKLDRAKMQNSRTEDLVRMVRSTYRHNQHAQPILDSVMDLRAAKTLVSFKTEREESYQFVKFDTGLKKGTVRSKPFRATKIL